MTATLAALVFAHALADFMLQTNEMVRRKKEPRVLLLHVGIVAAVSWLALGLAPAALAPVALVAATHLAIDAYKVHRLPKDLASFLADQAAHLMVLGAAALAFPGAYGLGLWAGEPALAHLPRAMAFLAGLVIATQAGSFAVGLLMLGLPPLQGSLESLPSGGRVIGLLERSMVYLFVLTGQMQALGFLLAAKSILRFGEVQADRRAAEYVIIGTLASFAWALGVALLARAALDALAAS
jgi:hypothetical protein